MNINWEEMKAGAEEEARAKEERFQKQFDKFKLRSEAWQKDLEKLSDMMHAGKNELEKELQEEEARHKQAVEEIKGRNRAKYGMNANNTEKDEMYRLWLKNHF